MKKTLTLLALMAVLLLAACAPTATMTGDDAMPDESMSDDATHDGDMADDMADDNAMMDSDETVDDNAMADEAMDNDEAMDDDESMTGDHAMAEDDEMMEDEAMANDAAMDDAMAAMDLPAWQTLPLVDARTGETFTLADFAGKTVFVEPMATWCTNCKRQLNNVRSAKEQSGDGVVYVALSVETNISADELAAYAANEEFDWTFAVMTPDLLREMAAAFGQTISNPPSTPHFIIRPDGSTTDLTTGIESPEEILGRIAAAQG